jgi:hypothetical protein
VIVSLAVYYIKISWAVSYKSYRRIRIGREGAITTGLDTTALERLPRWMFDSDLDIQLRLYRLSFSTGFRPAVPLRVLHLDDYIPTKLLKLCLRLSSGS